VGSFNALLVQRRVRSADADLAKYEAIQPAIRIPIITGFKSQTVSPGGWLSASFTIPAAYHRTGVPKNTQVWVYDGATLAFMGFASKAIPNTDGGLDVSLIGPYVLLGKTLMRSVWSDRDLAKWQPAPGNIQSSAVGIDASGRLHMSFPKDHSFPEGSYCAVDYFLFGEAAATRDEKLLDGYQITIASGSNLFDSGVLRVQVWGLASPGASGSAELIHSFTATGTRTEYSAGGTPASTFGLTRIGALPGAGDNIAAWTTVAGYRCIRVGIYVVGGNTSALTYDHNAIITVLRVSSRANALGFDPDPSTVDIIQDIWRQPYDVGNGLVGTGVNSYYDLHSLATAENPARPSPVTSGITDSGTKLNDFAITDWTTPRDIIEALAMIDGYDVGLYGPNENPGDNVGLGSVSAPNANWRHRRPGAVTYQAWRDLSDPDYYARLGLGAKWEPDDSEDTIASAVYASYSTAKGFARTVFAEDATVENYLYEAGWHEADAITLDQAVSDSTAQTLALQNLQRRRQPTLVGTLTITGDRPGQLELPGGARLGPLHQVRPGVVRIPDAKGAKHGVITGIDYSARTASQPETLVLHINAPAAVTHQRAAAKAARQHHRRIDLRKLHYK
jgi:hypothetical protein